MDAFLDLMHRFWASMIERSEGPMRFRFVLQPAAAVFLALRDGIRDAKTGRTPYFWLILHSDEVARRESWREGLKATARVLVLAVVMDVIYQFKVFGAFKYPGETLIVAIILGFLPYLLLRGPIKRVVVRWRRRSSST